VKTDKYDSTGSPNGAKRGPKTVSLWECDWSTPFLFEVFSMILQKKGELKMTDDKKKITYGTREEQLINGNDLQEKALSA